jgi:hypothetical protein
MPEAVMILEIPGGGIRGYNGTGERIRAIPLRNQEALFGVGPRPRRISMMAAKRLLNFVDRGDPFRARLAIPEHDKALPTNAATGLCVSIGALAQYLHFNLKWGANDPRHRRE